MLAERALPNELNRLQGNGLCMLHDLVQRPRHGSKRDGHVIVSLPGVPKWNTWIEDEVMPRLHFALRQIAVHRTMISPDSPSRCRRA